MLSNPHLIWAIGSGITTSLISLIVNAGPQDQAVATAGARGCLPVGEKNSKPPIAASYLYRSLGSVVGVSVGSTLLQEGLRKELRRELSGIDIEEVL